MAAPVHSVSAPRWRQVDRFDVHAHFVPDFYLQAMHDAGETRPDGMVELPKWDAESALATMDQLGVKTALLSIPTPGVHFGDDAKARELARKVNDEGARLKMAYPGRFGFFATLPLPDIAGSVAELVRALDQLGADGIVLLTNHRGVYLGNPVLDPIFAELNKRNAVVFLHPTSPCALPFDHIPRPMLEFIFETTRSVTDMVTAGVLQRNPNIRVIVPHAGAALTLLADRIDFISPMATHLRGYAGPGHPPPSMKDALKRLDFDFAGMPVPNTLRELLTLADHDRIHYGSDYPFTPAGACEFLMSKLEDSELLTEEQKRKFMGGNAAKLFPKLAEAGAELEAIQQ